MIKRIWILGGDGRTPYLIKELSKWGYQCFHSGLSSSVAALIDCPVKRTRDVNEDAIVLPVKGWSIPFKEAFSLEDKETMGSLKNTPIFVGQIDSIMATMIEQYNWNVKPYNNLEPFIKVNSLATAQGFLGYLLNHTNALIMNKKVLVIGFGESGQAIAVMLKNLVTEVVVVARRQETREKARELGINAIDFNQIIQEIETYDMVINTVPALILNEPILKKIPLSTQLIEIASPPGGFDRPLADKMLLKVTDLPGLPGIFAPKSSGEALAETLRKEFFYG